MGKRDVFPLYACAGEEVDLSLHHNCKYLSGSASLPTSPVFAVAPSTAVASRLARSFSECHADRGTV